MNPFDPRPASPEDEKQYFYQRAEAALEMAQRSSVPEAVKAHYTLAGHYLDKAYAPDAADAGSETATSDVE